MLLSPWNNKLLLHSHTEGDSIFMQAQENSHKPQTKYGLSHRELQAQLHNTEQTHWNAILKKNYFWYHSINSLKS